VGSRKEETMKRILLALMMVFVVVGFTWAENPTNKLYGISKDEKIKTQVIVRFRSEKEMKRFEKQFPGLLKHRFHRFRMGLAEITGREAAALARDRDVLSIESDGTYNLHYVGGVIPTDEYENYGLARMGITNELHDRGYLGQGVKVGIIDTGIAAGHPDLHVAGGWNFTFGIEASNNRYGDVLGHGTHVAGIIGARRNEYGLVGIAPEAEIYSLRCFTIYGTASLSAIIHCIQWAIDHKLDVLNMSFGSRQRSPALEDACKAAHEAGILLVASAGNEGRAKDNVGYPAKFDTVVAVSATDENDKIADFSSRGPAVEMAAPGVNILSTFTFPSLYESFWEYLSGTSMACPHVVGMAALIKSANPGMTNEEIRRRLRLFAKDLGPAGRDIDYGYGIPQPDRDPALIPNQSVAVANAGGPYVGVVGEPVCFSVSGTFDPDDNLLTHAWDFGDGETGEGRNPIHVYQQPGVYNATLTVTDQDGRTGRDIAEVRIEAGVNRVENIPASDTGFAREPKSLYHNSIIQAGVSSRSTYYGLIKFDVPPLQDARVLSAELVLTVATKAPRDQGIITAGLFPAGVVENWSGITYASVESAGVIPLDPPIVMSYLHTNLTQGSENRFSVSVENLAAFEEQFKRGGVAFRLALDTTLSSNRLEWTSPKLVVRYIEAISKENMPPVANAGFDRRVLAGSRVVVDGSGSYDWESTALNYRWVQKSGTVVSLSSYDTATTEFTAPAGDSVLVFELNVSDGILESSDEVKIFLNNAPPELHQVVLIPGVGNAGYVVEDHPTMNLFEKRVITVGALIREFRGPTGQPDGVATAVGAIRFDLSAIPPGSQVTSAVLELTGAEAGTDFGSKYVVKVLGPDVDERWSDLDYPTLTSAAVTTSLSPTLTSKSLGEYEVNRLVVNPAILESRRPSTNKLTFRIDGPTHGGGTFWTFFSWWSGNEEQTAVWGPRLIAEYGAIKAEEAPVPPTPGENLPPVPQISAETFTGRPGGPLNFTLSAVDPEGEQVSFQVDWGDGTSENTSFYISGETVPVSHTWVGEGNYVITVVATDEQGAASQPISLNVTIAETAEEVLVISDAWTGTWYLGTSYGRRRQAQTFKAVGSEIKGVSLALARIGNPRDPIRVTIRYSLSGTVLGSAEIQPYQVTSTDERTPGWVSVPLTAPVREGSSYYLVLEVNDSDGSNHYMVGYNSTNPYPYGIYYPDSGTSGRKEIDMACKIIFTD
jgi:subtilisin